MGFLHTLPEKSSRPHSDYRILFGEAFGRKLGWFHKWDGEEKALFSDRKLLARKDVVWNGRKPNVQWAASKGNGWGWHWEIQGELVPAFKSRRKGPPCRNIYWRAFQGTRFADTPLWFLDWARGKDWVYEDTRKAIEEHISPGEERELEETYQPDELKPSDFDVIKQPYQFTFRTQRAMVAYLNPADWADHRTTVKTVEVDEIRFGSHDKWHSQPPPKEQPEDDPQCRPWRPSNPKQWPSWPRMNKSTRQHWLERWAWHVFLNAWDYLESCQDEIQHQSGLPADPEADRGIDTAELNEALAVLPDRCRKKLRWVWTETQHRLKDKPHEIDYEALAVAVAELLEQPKPIRCFSMGRDRSGRIKAKAFR